MINVAIIDDGVGVGLYDIYNTTNSIEVTTDLSVQAVDKYNLSNSSHGTICAAIVKKYYPKAVLTSIKVLSDKSHKCKSDQLVKAIEWCIDNSIQVANLSLGTTDFRDFKRIEDVINRAYDKGLIIVAACNNRDIFTYPASCTNVIGVKCSKVNDLEEDEYIFNLYPIDGIEITCCSEHVLLKKSEELKITHKCNSYAAPMITAKVCGILSKFPNINLGEIKEELYKYSINYSNSKVRVNNCKNIDWISNAAVLDMNERDRDFNLPYINVDLFSTLILISNSKKGYEMIEHIIFQLEEKQKNIVFIDDGYHDKKVQIKYPNNNIKFWHPSIVKQFYEESLQKKEVDVPLIIVYDYTKNKMVKILETLTDKFRNDGYYALGASTKAIGVLHRLEYIPFSRDESLKKLKDKIEVLYKVYDYDIMILGLSINKEDIDIIKETNTCLDQDRTIFIVDDFVQEVSIYIEKTSTDQSLIITSQGNIRKYSYLGCKVFNYKDINLFYKEIFNRLLYEN